MLDNIARIDKPKKQCYFYAAEKNGCLLLNVDTCKGCKFYKTPRQYADDREEAERINERKKASE